MRFLEVDLQPQLQFARAAEGNSVATLNDLTVSAAGSVRIRSFELWVIQRVGGLRAKFDPHPFMNPFHGELLEEG